MSMVRDIAPAMASPIVYGELSILGYNGHIPSCEKSGRRNKSKFLLCQRPIPNGIKKARHYIVRQPQATRAIQDEDHYSISYTFSRSQTIVVEYKQDERTDMFQIGRSSDDPIDFVVMDTHATQNPISRFSCQILVDREPPYKAHIISAGYESSKNILLGEKSTISRFACRILVDREPPYTARIYAAGFDSSKNIFLGEKATKWEQNNSIDGLTTNGILLMHPRSSSNNNDTNNNSDNDTTQASPSHLGGVWREVSVDGGIYAIRESRSASQKGTRIESETNILQDGTLIDLCGATLLWRSLEGFKASPTKKSLEEKIDSLNASRPQCPVGLNTLVIPRRPIISNEKDSHHPYVYLKCGHVQGYHDWGATEKSNQRTCPICLSVGLVAKLNIGLEPSFYVDWGPLTHAFNPCGHMASEQTVKYWSTIEIPHGTHFFHAICPFCATPLAKNEPAAIKLIFQEDLD